MVCQNCDENNTESFEKATCGFDSRRSLVLFLLNVVLDIQEIWDKYCFCEKCVVPCLVCQFRIAYLNDEYMIYENSFNLQFLADFRQLAQKLKEVIAENGLTFYL